MQAVGIQKDVPNVAPAGETGAPRRPAALPIRTAVDTLSLHSAMESPKQQGQLHPVLSTVRRGSSTDSLHRNASTLPERGSHGRVSDLVAEKAEAARAKAKSFSEKIRSKKFLHSWRPWNRQRDAENEFQWMPEDGQGTVERMLQRGRGGEEKQERVTKKEERQERAKREEEKRLEREMRKEVEKARKNEEKLEQERRKEEEKLRKNEERLERKKRREEEKLAQEKRREEERLAQEKRREEERVQQEKRREEERLQREKRIEEERLQREKRMEEERLQQERLKQERQHQEQLEQKRRDEERLQQERLEQEKRRENQLQRDRLARIIATAEGETFKTEPVIVAPPVGHYNPAMAPKTKTKATEPPWITPVGV